MVPILDGRQGEPNHTEVLRAPQQGPTKPASRISSTSPSLKIQQLANGDRQILATCIKVGFGVISYVFSPSLSFSARRPLYRRFPLARTTDGSPNRQRARLAKRGAIGKLTSLVILSPILVLIPVKRPLSRVSPIGYSRWESGHPHPGHGVNTPDSKIPI
jgi:hypothetical protein